MAKEIFEICLLTIVAGAIAFNAVVIIKVYGRVEEYRNTIDEYKEKVRVYENGNEKVIDNVKIDSIEELLKGIDEKKSDNFYSCYMGSMSQDIYSDSLRNKIDEISDYFNSISSSVSFAYQDLYSGLRLGYNQDNLYFAASTIKAPVIMYVYKLVNEGFIDLNEVMTYTSSFYIGGTGSIKNEPYGSRYTIRELARRAIVQSDNIAYSMLCYRIRNTDVRSFWRNAGASTFWSNQSIWGNVKSSDGVIYMKELYKFLEESPSVRDELIDYYSNASLKLINVDDTVVLHKSGWTGAAIHDAAIVYSSQPYVLSINTSLGNGNFRTFFSRASSLVNEFHNMYWREKQQFCYTKYIEN